MGRWFRFLAALFPAAFCAAALSAAENDVLYWMVDGAASVAKEDGTEVDVRTFLGGLAGSDFAARVRVTGGDIAGDTFLDLYDPSDGTTYSGWLGVDFDPIEGGGSGYWGAGVPDGNQSPSGQYSAGTPEYSFTVEIGNVAWDDASGGWSWTTVATGASATYSSLAAHISPQFDLNPPAGVPWSPASFTAVPEPSGGMLAAFGSALLALRRRRFAA